jgi:hypothetical protein
MSPVPRLTAVQWRAIASILPSTKRDPVVITALIYRATTATSLRDTAALFGTSRARLHEWEAALTADGSLDRVLNRLNAVAIRCVLRASWGKRAQAQRHSHRRWCGDAMHPPASLRDVPPTFWQRLSDHVWDAPDFAALSDRDKVWLMMLLRAEPGKWGPH